MRGKKEDCGLQRVFTPLCVCVYEIKGGPASVFTLKALVCVFSVFDDSL